jgi:ABC-2 type transport system permease protein
MRRYLQLFGLFVRSSLLTRLEYRAEFVIGLFQSLFWSALVIASVLVFFQYAPQIGGWRWEEALLVIGLFRFFQGVIEGALRPNSTRLVEHIGKGTFDFILLKPADSQFSASLRELNIPALLDCPTGLIIVLYGLVRIGRVPSALELLLFGLLLVSGLLIAYAIWMLLVTTAFWLVRIENIAELLSIIYETGRFPVNAFSPPVQALLTFVVPIAFLTTFPAAALTGRLTLGVLLAAPLLAALLLVASRLFWRRALRAYSGAGG